MIENNSLIVSFLITSSLFLLYYFFSSRDKRRQKPELWDLSLMHGFSDFNNDKFQFLQSVISKDIYLKYPNGFVVEFEENSYLVTSLVGYTSSGISLIAFNKKKLIKSLTHL